MNGPRYDVKIARTFPPDGYHLLTASSAAITVTAHTGVQLEKTRALVNHATETGRWEGHLRGAIVTITLIEEAVA